MAAGGDEDLIAALEDAARGFPLVPPDVIQETKAAIVDRGHPEIEELERLRLEYDRLVNTAGQLLKGVADRELVDLSSPTDFQRTDGTPFAAARTT